MRQVLLQRGEDGWWVAEVPSLPGAVSQGRTKAEAIENIRDAIELLIDVMREHGDPIPEDDFEAVLVAV
jgi:predicted RNase H-like HicB family nuclease